MMGSVQLTCKRCGAELHARDVDFEALRATCRSCGWQIGGAQQGVYRERGREEDSRAIEKKSEDAPRIPLPPLPHNITIVEDSAGVVERLVVEIRPERMWRIYLIVALLSLQWGTYVLLRGMPPWIALAIFVPVVWGVGAFMGNTRTLTVERGQLRVEHRPFPRPSKVIEITDLDQLWVDEYVYKQDVTYRLRARTRNGKDQVLVDQLTQPTGALHLERRIEELLGIVDKPVAGEVPPLNL